MAVYNWIEATCVCPAHRSVTRKAKNEMMACGGRLWWVRLNEGLGGFLTFGTAILPYILFRPICLCGYEDNVCGPRPIEFEHHTKFSSAGETLGIASFAYRRNVRRVAAFRPNRILRFISTPPRHFFAKFVGIT